MRTEELRVPPKRGQDEIVTETRREASIMEQRTVEMQQRFVVEKRSTGLSASEIML